MDGTPRFEEDLLPLNRNCTLQALDPPQPQSQSQNSPFCGSFAKSLASWQRNIGTPLRSNCFIRIRVIDIALVLQSQGMGTKLSNPLRW